MPEIALLSVVVEFSDDSGRTYLSLARRGDQLMLLHHAPAHQAA